MANYTFKGKDFSGNPNYRLSVSECHRCCGDGIWKGYISGVCFACEGVGNIGSYKPTDEWAAVLSARQASKLSRERAKAVAKRVSVAFAHPWAYGVAIVLGFTPCADKGVDIAWHIFSKFLTGKELSDKQAAQLLRVGLRTQARVAKDAAEADEPKVPVVAGKGVAVTGTVLSVQWRENDYGVALKMLVKDDRGFKLWGTVPSALLWKATEHGESPVDSDELKGARVEFTANVEVSKDDEFFGFASRPRKASMA